MPRWMALIATICLIILTLLAIADSPLVNLYVQRALDRHEEDKARAFCEDARLVQREHTVFSIDRWKQITQQCQPYW